MSAAVQELLAAFDALPESDRGEAVAAILARHPLGEGAIPDAGFVELADELFQSYDAAEADDAARPG